ncbi:MAG: hypothetical protein WBE26_02470 [Phycisphaerae bacterium]
MDELEGPTTSEPEPDLSPEAELPPGNHALEIAARRGIGPLSPYRREVWHGEARPCVSCGQLVLRDATECDYCGQDLSEQMLEKMRAHAGPWYVLEHVRPFPGVSLERIVRQIHRRLITETSIIRGPSTDFQWRFAVEAPGLCRYFGRCWHCHGQVSPSDTYCQHCLAHLSFEKPRTPPAVPPGPGTARPLTEPDETLPSTPTDELKELSAAVCKAALPSNEAVWDEPPRIAGIRATWVVVGFLIVVIVALMFLTGSRSQSATPAHSATPGMILPYLP